MTEAPVEKVKKGTRIRIWQERVLPLGPFAGTLLVDFPEQLAALHAAAEERMAAQGIDVVALPEFDRGEWLGVFTYELEIVIEVVGFHATADRTEEEAQQASLVHVLAALFVLTSLVLVGWIAAETAEPFTEFVEAFAPVLPIISIALGFLAIALLVREIRKTSSLGKGLIA